MADTYKGKSMKLGGGGRFEKGADKLEAKGESAHEAKAVMAIAGRKKYGEQVMSRLAQKGK